MRLAMKLLIIQVSKKKPWNNECPFYILTFKTIPASSEDTVSINISSETDSNEEINTPVKKAKRPATARAKTHANKEQSVGKDKVNKDDVCMDNNAMESNETFQGINTF